MAMTNHYVAFLRAINVGGRVVKMSDLKTIFEKTLRLADVSTFIASGNVVFKSSRGDTAKLEKQIERGLQTALGFTVVTFLRTRDEVAAVAGSRPFPKAADNGTLYVGFLPAAPTREAARLVSGFRTETDEFAVSGRELYWLCRTNMMESRFNYAVLEKAVKMQATFRNVTTIRRLAAKYPPIDS